MLHALLPPNHIGQPNPGLLQLSIGTKGKPQTGTFRQREEWPETQADRRVCYVFYSSSLLVRFLSNHHRPRLHRQGRDPELKRPSVFWFTVASHSHWSQSRVSKAALALAPSASRPAKTEGLKCGLSDSNATYKVTIAQLKSFPPLPGSPLVLPPLGL